MFVAFEAAMVAGRREQRAARVLLTADVMEDIAPMLSATRLGPAGSSSPPQRKPRAIVHPLALPMLPALWQTERAKRRTASPSRESFPVQSTPPFVRTDGGTSLWPTNGAETPVLLSSGAPCHVQVRSPTILAPSLGLSNDTARVRNCGKALRGAPAAAVAAQLEEQFALRTPLSRSAPSLASPDGPTDRSTPRRARGLVRQASKVLVHYPDVDPRMASPHLGVDGQTAHFTSFTSSPSRRQLSPKANTKSREECFWPKAFDIVKEGSQSIALAKSRASQSALADLRRCSKVEKKKTVVDLATSDPSAPGSGADGGGGEGQAPPPAEADPAGGEAGPEAPPAEVDDAPMNQLLKDASDCEADLRDFELTIATSYDSGAESGATRHATMLISGRMLEVVRRKADLLRDVEQRVVSFERAHAQRDETLKQLIGGARAEEFQDLYGVLPFVKRFTHVGGPQNADKSDFVGFVRSFKLPAEHKSLQSLRNKVQEVGEWWAATVLDQAEQGTGHKQLEQMFEVALKTGADPEHFMLVRARKIIVGRLADRCLEEAKELFERDRLAEERSKVPRVGPAAEAADQIEQLIFKAVKEGVSEKERRLELARSLVRQLREADGQRKRKLNRLKKQEQPA